MAIMRTRSRLTSSSQAPPPSPIPTGKGSRSAADSIVSDYISRSLKLPDLSLPEYVHRSVPAYLDLRSLLSREGDSVKRLLRSASEFGVFRVSGHGIRVEELRSALAEADIVFRVQEGRRSGYFLDYGGCEKFLWRRFEAAVAEQAREVIGAEKFRCFSQKMETVANELESIAGELAKVISDSAKKKLTNKQIQSKQSLLSLYRYEHDDAFRVASPPLSNDRRYEASCEYALSLHLLLNQCEFHVQSDRGPLSFNASPDTIIITLGKQLEEWSLGEVKCAYGEVTFESNLSSTGPSFSIKLESSPSNFKHHFGEINRTILVSDQILFIIFIMLLYDFLMFMLS